MSDNPASFQIGSFPMLNLEKGDYELITIPKGTSIYPTWHDELRKLQDKQIKIVQHFNITEHGKQLVEEMLKHTHFTLTLPPGYSIIQLGSGHKRNLKHSKQTRSYLAAKRRARQRKHNRGER